MQNPSVCREEKRKARYLVVDAACCMVTILIMSGNTQVAEQAYFPARVVSTPFMVYAIHGCAGKTAALALYLCRSMFCACSGSHVCDCAVVLGGFRVSADVYLHFLNVQVYVITKVTLRGGFTELWPTVPDASAAFCVCTLLPLTIAALTEAKERSDFLHRQHLSQEKLGAFWTFVLKLRGATKKAE